MLEQKGLSRRRFLAGAGIATGVAVAAAGSGLIKPKLAEASYTALPWPYAQLNLAVVKRRAYDHYYASGGCMSGTGIALVQTLVETVGTPWDSIPQDMFRYGAGGIHTWGTTCGAIHGAAWVIQACAGANTTSVINDLFKWYDNFPFPTRDHDSYARFTRQKTSVSNSTLCHASASNWAHSTKNKINSDARKDRCAKVAGDVAGKTAELLNALFAGTYVPAFTQPDPTCSGCHVGSNSTHDHVQMKSTCTSYCHSDKKTGHY
jgi:hypothetical protein